MDVVAVVSVLHGLLSAVRQDLDRALVGCCNFKLQTLSLKA